MRMSYFRSLRFASKSGSLGGTNMERRHPWQGSLCAEHGANQSLGRHASSHWRANYGFMVAAESFLQALAPHARAGAAAAKPDAGVPALGQTKDGLQLRRGFPGPDPTTHKAGLRRLAHHKHGPRPVQDRPPPNPHAWAAQHQAHHDISLSQWWYLPCA